jgi:hypothetical protein
VILNRHYSEGIADNQLLGSDCNNSGMNAQRTTTGNRKCNAANRLSFQTYPAFLRSAADRTDPVLPWVVSRGRSYGFLWAESTLRLSEEERSNFNLLASKKFKCPHDAR